MSVNKINPVYTASTKAEGDTLAATEWNNISSAVNEALTKINEIIEEGTGEGSGAPIDTSGIITVSNKGNVTLGSNKNINLEPAWNNNNQSYTGNQGDIALKPGDDIQLCSHHREPKKRDKIVVKAIDGSDNPVKMQIVAGELEFAAGSKSNPKSATLKKDKTTGADTTQKMFKTDDAKVVDMRILTGNVLDENTEDERDERGYLKVRAQAIDLRCEKHGGIALQPKGYDANGNMNKIKFEHGGGDGLEFGTFNSEKTSIFTNEYRFNKDGVWKMSTRFTEASGKNIIDEREGGLQGLPATGAYKYKKNTTANNTAVATETGNTYEPADDFYDFVDTSDVTATTEDIIKTANAFNGNSLVHAKITSKGNLEIASVNKWTLSLFTPINSSAPDYPDSVIVSWYDWDNLDLEEYNPEKGYTLDELATILKVYDSDNKPILKALLIQNGEAESGRIYVSSESSGDATGYYEFNRVSDKTPNINIESDADISIKSENKLELKGILDFGSTFNFGETDKGIETLYKRTAKNKTKDCGIIKVVATNNSSSAYSFNTIWDPTANDNAGANQTETTVSLGAGESQVIAQCSLYDIIKLVNYMKDNNEGPWAAQQ